MKIGVWLCIAFISIWSVVLMTSNETLGLLFLLNAVLQVSLFVTVACIPFLKTGRMSYVDIAWPFGVALIGLQILLLGDGDIMRRGVVGGIYLLIGLRMGLGAIAMAKATGVIFGKEFPRYDYVHLTLKGVGRARKRFHILAEIMAQGFANISVLAIPGFMLAINQSVGFSTWEIAGLILWFTAYGLEMTADLQKLDFMKRNKGRVCNVGLWRYSRHPNYFAEWLVWTALLIASVPSWLALEATETTLVWFALGVGALGASAMLYTTLVFITGAIPAEYYSVRKRPDYAEYQATTNRFFPWFPK